MAKKIISEEVIVDSDDGLSDSDTERQLESNAVAFTVPRKYTKETKFHTPKDLKNLGKKDQVWLIKVPKDVDIKSLDNISVDDDFEINGRTYNSEIENVGEKFQILTPNDDTLRYNGLHVSKMLNISEFVKIPEINYDAVRVHRVDVEKETDLEMRHFPTGYGRKDFIKEGRVEKKKHREEKSEKKEKKDKKDKKDKKEKKEKKDKKEKKEKN